ncbi:uncharacterized protein J3D65DRAFT_621693 [Phyllosticta citribraziliensis]|uniref:COP9 signalosome complex subunit 6 n=1 Tax=Phyllosticta citribraziliensis TaxID=989973 RepID=A0ABR1LUJ8_9PEZI
MTEGSENPLISTTRASDTSPHVQLHPLVLLTVSDYITRHTLRQQSGPVVGAIIGQQNGREITMEVAFECKLIPGEDGEARIDHDWFCTRLEQYKTVYKSPALDLVAWFTLGAHTGPAPHHLPIHEYIQNVHNETSLLLLFNPESVLEGNATGGRLPLGVYESLWEGSSGSNDKGAAMDIDGATPGQGKQLKFRELTYAVETGEAEMIAVDFVAKGGGNATEIPKATATAGPSDAGKGKGKKKAENVNGAINEDSVPLSSEDEELLSSLTAKTNAIRMLRTRVSLLQTYLESLPPSYLTDASISMTTSPSEQPNHEIFRSINSLVSRLPLLEPSDRETFAREAAEQRSDVALTSLLAGITASLADASQLGKKSAIVENARQAKLMSSGGGPPGLIRGPGGFGRGSGAFEAESLMGMGGNGGMGGSVSGGFPGMMGSGSGGGRSFGGPFMSPGDGRSGVMSMMGRRGG